MGKMQDPIFLKPSANNDDETGPLASEDIYLSGLNALREELSALCADEPHLNKLELTSVTALIDYTSYAQGMSEDVVRSMVEAHFGAKAPENILSRDYDAVIRFLVDLSPKEAMN